ncbi:hypothetical protein CPB86DRAFT_209693 [Serendipita vermifera]|nr:hypothetical protein CPB86DRAFT_209693 [Serendipita vermifera]
MASAGMTDDATIFRQLVRGMLSLQDSRYTSAAAVTVWMYDIFLTLDIEVEFIWSDFQFTIPNALYILNRYGCLGFFLVTIYDLAGYRSDQSESYCRKGLQVVGFVIAHLCWTIIMTLRVTALWSQNKMLVRTIWVLWACTICAITIMASMAHIQVSGGIVYDPTIRMCVPTTILPPVMTTSPIAPALYELLLTVLTIVKIYNHGSIVGDSYISPLMRTLTRDGVIYFVMSNALAIANLLCWNLLPPSHSLILLYLYWGVVAT